MDDDEYEYDDSHDYDSTAEIASSISNNNDDDQSKESTFSLTSSVPQENVVFEKEEMEQWSIAIHTALQRLYKKRNSLQSEFDKVQGADEILKRAQLLISNLYLFPKTKEEKKVSPISNQTTNTSTAITTTTTVMDWENNVSIELTLSPLYESATAEAEALFVQARKYKRCYPMVQDLLQQTNHGITILETAQKDLLQTTSSSSSAVSSWTVPTVDEEEQQEQMEDIETSSHDCRKCDPGRFALIQDRLLRTMSITNFQIPKSNKNHHDSSSPPPQQQGSNRHRNSSSGQNGQQTQHAQQSLFQEQSQPQKRRERKKPPELGTPASNIRKVQSPDGTIIYIGRNRRGNEYLSLSLAKHKNDIWMHSRNCPGAHVLIKWNPSSFGKSGSTRGVSEECLQWAANLAIFYSDLRNENKAEVTVAQPKHIIKPKGAPVGAIKIRKEYMTLMGRPSQVPDALKVAREESGQLHEYHITDKAKHRRRTKQAAKEDHQNRRRQKQKQKEERRAQQP